MEGRQMAMGGGNPLAMPEAAEETVWTSASVAALERRAPTGVGPPLRASLLGDGHHWPPYASRRNMAMQLTVAKALSPGRRELQQTQVHLTPAKGGSSTNATTLVDLSPCANRSPHAHKQLNALPANAHLDTTHMHSRTVRRSPTPTDLRQPTPTHQRQPTSIPNRQPTPNPVQSVAWNTDAAGVKPPTLRTNPHLITFLDEEQQLRAATRVATGKSPSRKAVQPVQFPQ